MPRRRKKKEPLNRLQVLEKLVLRHVRMRAGPKKEFSRAVIDALLENGMMSQFEDDERVEITHDGVPVKGTRALLERCLKQL